MCEQRESPNNALRMMHRSAIQAAPAWTRVPAKMPICTTAVARRAPHYKSSGRNDERSWSRNHFLELDSGTRAKMKNSSVHVCINKSK